MIYDLLLSSAARAALVLALGLVAYALLLLLRSAAATRRLVLVLTLGAAILVPVAAAVGPRWSVQAPAALSVFAHESSNEGAPGTASAGNAAGVAPIASAPPVVSASPWNLGTKGALVFSWLVLATALLLRAAASQLQAWAIARRAAPVDRGAWTLAAEHAGAGRHVRVRVSSELDAPAVTGLFRATIVVPRAALDWPATRCRLVLIHELAHVRRRDVLAQALADVACALHWCNPLVWVCARRLRIERELAADDAVLAAGFRPSHYAEELLDIATLVATPTAALAMAERSSLEFRVASILSPRLARAPLAARGTLAVVAAGAALAAAAACTSPVGSAPPRATENVAPRLGTADDAAIQRAVDDEMATITAAWSPELATIIVLDPVTGEILANAGRREGNAAEVATTAAMAPGSTMKSITIAAALELHAIRVDQQFESGPSPRMYGAKAFEDHDQFGTLDLAHVVAFSSNIGSSRVFDALGGDNLVSWLHRFHFGEASGVPGGGPGAFPEHIENGSFVGATVATGMRMTATPLQMIAAYGVFASGGVYHAPTFDKGGSAGERLISPETAKSVVTLLEAVVTDEGGTGKAARVEGVRVAGKTGTAEWTAQDGRDRTYASFIGVADLPSRRIVALIGIEAARDDLSGPGAAAPAFARLVKRIR